MSVIDEHTDERTDALTTERGGAVLGPAQKRCRASTSTAADDSAVI